MKLFDDYEAVLFPEENLIFITHDKYLYYYFNPKYRHWYKYKRAGWDRITVKNYPDISKEDLSAATGGKLPEKKSEMLRLLYPSDLSINNMFTLFEEDYPEYMHDYTLTCIAGGMAEAMYGPVREYLKQECRKRLEPDMVKVLDRFEEYLKDRKGFSDK